MSVRVTKIDELRELLYESLISLVCSNSRIDDGRKSRITGHVAAHQTGRHDNAAEIS
jgi:hypothetical protein